MHISKFSDQDLVSAYLGGKELAFQVLVERHKDRIFSYIMMLIKDEELANDVFQDTFIKAINTMKRGAYNEEGKFLPWILRIAHNLIIDHFRRLKRMPTTAGTDEYNIFDKLVLDDQNAEEFIVNDQIKQDLRKLIQRLPEEQRQVLEMRHFCDMSFKEISEETNVSINTALGRMRYALINLRKLIQEHNVSLSL